jgi:hypothetical protein
MEVHTAASMSAASLNAVPASLSDKKVDSVSVWNASPTTSTEKAAGSGNTQVATVELEATPKDSETRNSNKRVSQDN